MLALETSAGSGEAGASSISDSSEQVWSLEIKSYSARKKGLDYIVSLLHLRAKGRGLVSRPMPVRRNDHAGSAGISRAHCRTGRLSWLVLRVVDRYHEIEEGENILVFILGTLMTIRIREEFRLT